DTIVDLVIQEDIVGKLIVHHQDKELVEQLKDGVNSVLMMTFILIGLLCLVFIFYIHATMIKPFNKLQDFASRVARGILDVPLSMDKHNHFGAFTESFDLMREELAAARQR